MLAIGNRADSPACLVEQAVNAALGRTFEEAEALMLSRFGAVTLAHLCDDFHERLSAHKQSYDLDTIHAT
ncbi:MULTISPECIES: hypothetical protein [Mesorhizobium]|uniref:hypothetical protein n=1 Tax=Mesorhizobium TaxID=68287 RepID=UPI0018DBF8BD|nr:MULTISPECIES: hypothetical protein [Mesorhizobium]WJI35740.1 hypothetical protein NL534_17580 [Mesorhizobium opportunistum]